MDRDDVLDAALFRLWCRAASTHPGLVATKLAPCLTADQYRNALMEVAAELRINLPTGADTLTERIDNLLGELRAEKAERH